MSGGGAPGRPADAAAVDRERRLALNEALERDVNEFVADVASGWSGGAEPVEFRCECVRRDCQERLRLTREEYAGVRESPVTFVVAPGHEAPDVEDVVGRVGDYRLVRKIGPGHGIAEATDPRREG